MRLARQVNVDCNGSLVETINKCKQAAMAAGILPGSHAR